MKKTSKKNKGSALIVSILVLILIVLIAMSVALVTVQNQAASIGEYRSSQSFQTTDTVLESAIYDLTKAGYATVDQLFPGDCSADGNFKIDDGEIELVDVNNNQVDCASATPTALVSRIKAVSYVGGQSRSIQASVICATPYESDDNTVALYNFKERMDTDPVSDASGLNTDGDVHTGGSVTIESGVCKARRFDGGSSDYIEIPDDQSTSAIQRDESMTVSAWVKWEGLSNQPERIVGKGDNNVRTNYELAVSNNNGWEFRVGNSGGCDVSTNYSLDDSWHFITGVYDKDAQEVRIYIDDRSPVTSGCSATPPTNTDMLTIGGSSVGGEAPFEGLIDEVKISKIALDDGDVTAEYEKGKIFNLP